MLSVYCTTTHWTARPADALSSGTMAIEAVSYRLLFRHSFLSALDLIDQDRNSRRQEITTYQLSARQSHARSRHIDKLAMPTTRPILSLNDIRVQSFEYAYNINKVPSVIGRQLKRVSWAKQSIHKINTCRSTTQGPNCIAERKNELTKTGLSFAKPVSKCVWRVQICTRDFVIDASFA